MEIGFSRRTVLGFVGVLAVPTFARDKPFILRTDDGRESSITVWRANGRKRGTILFSHGALSAPWKYGALIAPWVAAGFDVYAPLHVDSIDHPDTAKFKGVTSWPARIADMRALAQHIGGGPYVAAGHSYGALMALTLGGASAMVPPGTNGPLRDPNAKAVIAFSPPGPTPGLIDAAGYAALAVPAFIETGTKDIPPGSTEWQPHLAAYEAATAGGNRYGLVLEGVDHYFGGLICRPELPGPHQSAQFDQATALSTLFLRTSALHDQKAAARLKAQLQETGATRLMHK
jgi:pimeloyl-ACP methyl ester carboxylesterase